MSVMTPSDTVYELDKHIIGQADAKRAIAIALRNRWRRMQLDDSMRREITPKNILMIGPTGVGKTEIARRVARLEEAPFIKVEATKFTEVGYVGRDVESIIRDLAEMSFKMLREKQINLVKPQAERAAEERILNALENRPRNEDPYENQDAQESAARQMLRKKLIAGELDDKEIEIELAQTSVGVEIMAPPGMEEMSNQLQSLLSNMSSGRKKKQKLRVKAALKQLYEEEASLLVSEDEIKAASINLAEQNGIVFIDEIDKVCRSSKNANADISREGVQRDLLPLIEGSTVSTKYGLIKTDHILFVASGAFHLSKPSDLIPELQGRLPIRVNLNALTPDDFQRILTEPDYSLTEQYKALLKTEGIQLEVTDDGIAKIAETAWQVNENTENIGARRLHTVMERLLEEISFTAYEAAKDNPVVTIDAEYVQAHVGKLVKDNDLSRYIL